MSKIPDTTAEIRVALDGLSWGDAVKLIHEWLRPLPPPGSTRVRMAVGWDRSGMMLVRVRGAANRTMLCALAKGLGLEWTIV